MEITSGGTPGPRLDQSLWELGNNVQGSFSGLPEPLGMAEVFLAAGWRARKSSRTDYEVEHTWACLEFFRNREQLTLLAGVIDPGRAELLVATFAGLGYPCEFSLADGREFRVE